MHNHNHSKGHKPHSSPYSTSHNSAFKKKQSSNYSSNENRYDNTGYEINNKLSANKFSSQKPPLKQEQGNKFIHKKTSNTWNNAPSLSKMTNNNYDNKFRNDNRNNNNNYDNTRFIQRPFSDNTKNNSNSINTSLSDTNTKISTNENNQKPTPNTKTESSSNANVSTKTFEELQLIEPLLRAITEEGYTNPTPIQEQAIPQVLAGKDLIGIAQTGTGKTAAFTLPLLQRLYNEKKTAIPGTPRVLVLAPTRELAGQIGESFATYGRYVNFKQTVIFGGVGQGQQVQSLSRGVDILIATPGRLLDLMNQRYIKLTNVEYLVLDEADRMLDMGFIQDIKKILGVLPHKRQTLFFSATMPYQVDELARRLLTHPVQISVTPQATTVEKIEQRIFFVDPGHKEQLLIELLRQEHLTCVLVFTRTKQRANKLTRVLDHYRIRSDAIHGNKSQTHRQKALDDFKSGRIQVLVATDIAARGIDIDNISHVINYDLPNEPESYVHRIGRTARAGAEGTAYSFCAADERNYLHDIERITKQKIPVMEHKFHSKTAMEATGAAARPPPKKMFSRHSSGNNSRGNRSANHGHRWKR